MFNNFSISEKFFIRNVVDIFILISIFAVFSLLKIYNVNTVQLMLTLFVVFVIVSFLQIIINLWLKGMVVESISQNSVSYKTTLADVNELLKKQKQVLKSYIETMNNYTEEEKKLIKSYSEEFGVLKQKIQIISDLILELNEYSKQINSNIGVVENIAEQTNMLALNAAVEAARAGENGKGFAVVAGEIRKLADEAKNAASKISSLTEDVNSVSQSSVNAADEGVKEIDSVKERTKNAGKICEKTILSIKLNFENIKEITASTQKVLAENFSNIETPLRDDVLNK